MAFLTLIIIYVCLIVGPVASKSVKPDGSGGGHRSGLSDKEYRITSSFVDRIKRILRSTQSGLTMSSRDDLVDGGTNIIGDIALNQLQAEYVLELLISQAKRRRRRKVVNPVQQNNNRRYVFKKWPTTIHYVINTGDFSPEKQETIRHAVRFWSDKTCIVFHEGVPDNAESMYIVFQDEKENPARMGCWSYLGMSMISKENENSVAQPINLNPKCFRWVGVPIHEIGHALLLIHEQQRHVRDDYIILHLDTVNNTQSYVTMKLDLLYDDVIPFDYGSVMMYGSRASSGIYNLMTIETDNHLHQQSLGQRAEPSFFDVKAINRLYCNSTCQRTMACKRGGYPDPSPDGSCMKCHCPAGFGGTDCGQVASSSSGCSPSGGIKQVTTTEQCLKSPGYDSGSYPKGSYCHWHLQAPANATILARFTGPFGTLCKDTKYDCMHWVEIKNDTGLLLTGFRFCCAGTPIVNITARSEMMVIFNAKLTAINSYYDKSYYQGFKLCYRLVDGDPCLPNPCRNGGTCVVDGSSYQCSCHTGNYGSKCQHGDPCLRKPCRNRGTCVADGKSYQCRCLEEYVGSDCQKAAPWFPILKQRSDYYRYQAWASAREAAPIVAHLEPNLGDPYIAKDLAREAAPIVAHREPSLGGPYIVKDLAREAAPIVPLQETSLGGPYIARDLARDPGNNRCQPNPCRNGGTCQVNGNSYRCRCRTGYTGSNCQMLYSCRCTSDFIGMYGLASAMSDVQSIRIFQMQRWVERLRKRLDDAVAGHKGEIAKALENKIERIEGNGCNLREFQCGGSRPRCLSNLLVCDGDAECPNGADENGGICNVVLAPGTTWVGRIHWKACKLRNDQIFRMTIISTRRKSYFKPREWVTASVVTEYQEEGEARSETFTLEGFWVYASRRLVLKPRAGASDKIGAVCHALGDGAHADCHMVRMGAARDLTVCASGRVRKQ